MPFNFLFKRQFGGGMLVIDKHIHFIKLDMFIFYPLAQLFQNSHVKRNTKHLFLNVSYDSLLAENTGFEPADALTSTVFKTAALNHSANSPHLFLRRSENRCNGLPKRDAWFDIKFCRVNESAWLEDFSIYLGLCPKTAALNHSTGSHICFCVGQKTVATVCQNKTQGLY